MDRAMQERLVGASLLVLIAVLLIPWLLDGSSESVGQHSMERELILPGAPGSDLETRTISLDAPSRGGASSSPPALDTRRVKEVGDSTVKLVKQEVEPEVVAAAPVADQVSSKPNAVSAPSTSGNNTAASLASKSSDSDIEKTPTPVAVAVAAGDDSSQQAPAASVKVAKPATNSAPPATFSTPMREAAAVSDGTLGWAVQVGAFARQENAERLAERLRDKKYKAFVMRNVVDGRVRFRVRVGPVKQRADADLLAAALTEDRQPAKVLQHP